jgi:molybdopterin molybdotransferase/putative molybdopterin biosynthesis protein
MGSEEFENRLRECRNAASLTQVELARRAGISRQSLIHLESGKFVASTTVALKLARALGCAVEDLFSLPQAPVARLRADLAQSFPPGPTRERSRTLLGFVEGRWVAHRLQGEEALTLVADGVVTAPGGLRAKTVDVDSLRPESDMRDNLIVAGCDPALTLIAAWLAESSQPVRVRVLHAPSRQALAALGDGLTHVSGTHLLDEVSGDYNVPFVRRSCQRRGAIVFNLARWEEGFVVRAGNPLSIQAADDLARRRIRLVERERGSGAQSLLDRALRKAGVPVKATRPIAQIARGHLGVAQAVACGAADVGVATRSAAAAYDLGFVPLTEERSDLVVGAELRDDPRIGRLVDALRGAALRRELASLRGYQTDDSGQVVAEVSGT